MKLTELDPTFLVITSEKSWRQTDNINEAQGIMFLCPVCFTKNNGRVGTHRVICWSKSRGVPDNYDPKPGRWMLDGTGYNDLTLNGDPPGNARSVLLLTGEKGCQAHFHVTNGNID